jgi:hypothetical protein
MNNHSYLRAYMAGISVPTPLLLVALTLFSIARFVCNVPVPVERVIIFPMAIIPNLFGVWNMLHLASRSLTHLPLARDSRRDSSLHPRARGIPPRSLPGFPEGDRPRFYIFRHGGDSLCARGASIYRGAGRLLPGLEIPDRILESSRRNRRGVKILSAIGGPMTNAWRAHKCTAPPRKVSVCMLTTSTRILNGRD